MSDRYRTRILLAFALLSVTILLAGCEPAAKFSSRLGEAVEIAEDIRGALGTVNLTQVCASHQLAIDEPLSNASPDDRPNETELLLGIRPALRPGETIDFQMPDGQIISPVRRHPSGRFVTLDLNTDIITVDVMEAIDRNQRVSSIEVNCRYAYPEIPDEARIPKTPPGLEAMAYMASPVVCQPPTASCNDVYNSPSLFWKPNDTEFNAQNLWGLESIRAFDAWENGIKLADDVLVAVIDTGVTYNHPELEPNIWRNPNAAETNNPNDGQDNDDNGCADDIVGCTFDAASGCPVPATLSAGVNCEPIDYYGHGTIVASVLGSDTDNASGLASPAWKVTLIPIRVGNLQDLFTPEDLASAIAYADNVGADIANISLSLYRNASPVVKDEIQLAGDILFVIAAGNDFPEYPAAFDLDNIISVSGILPHSCSEDEAVGASLAWDPAGVDIGAPGVQICAICGTGYCYDQGSSVAAPFVSSAAALIETRGNFAPSEIRQLFIDNSRFSAQMADSVSHGTLDISFLPNIDDPPPWWSAWLILLFVILIAVLFYSIFKGQ